MGIEVKVPALGESITEATLGQWLKQPGDAVAADEPIASLETDKVAVEVPAPAAGTMGAHVVAAGDTVAVGALIASIESGGSASAPKAEGRSEPATPDSPAPFTPNGLVRQGTSIRSTSMSGRSAARGRA